jgi:Xaa-Pro aminopeptidase
MHNTSSVPEQELVSRLQNTRRLLQERGLDGLIAFSSSAGREGHVCYLTDHRLPFLYPASRKLTPYAALVLPVEGQSLLVSPTVSDDEKIAGVDCIRAGVNWVDDVEWAVRERKLDGKKVGIAGTDVVPAAYYGSLTKSLPRTTFEDAGDLLAGQRAKKSQAEVDLLREAARIADAALEAGMDAAREGAQEYEVELAARRAALEAGADFVTSIRVSSGKRIVAPPWTASAARELQPEDLVYLQVVGRLHNYGFDASRARAVGGPTLVQQEYLDHLIEAVEWMVDVLKPGTTVQFVRANSRGRSILPFANGIGVEIGESPWVTPGVKLTPQPGMVLCVKPTVNSSQFGSMAIGDMVVINETGVEILNHCPRIFW